MNAWILSAFGLNIAIVLMLLIWFVCRRLNNAGFVDAVWSYGFAIIVVVYAALGSGDPIRRWLLAGMVGIWSIRLGTHLIIRLCRHHPKEDARYAALRLEFPKRPWLMFLGFFLLQGVLMAVLCTPFAIAAANDAPIGAFEIAGALLWLIGIGGEALADHQLTSFNKDPKNKGGVCNVGLWKYSRHPNYFFEWIIWIAYFVFACGSPWGWISIICPLLMLHFLTKVTGIPPSETQSLKSRGQAYRNYQKTTSPFIPWKPKTL